MNRAAKALLDELEFNIRPTQRMNEPTVAEMQLVEIAKALSHDAEVIFLDEPTSVIGEREVPRLFSAIRRLQALGRGVVYVSHRLSKIFEIADTYTAFRDDAYVGSGSLAEVNRQDLIRMIVGRELSDEYVKTNQPTDVVGIEVDGLCRPDAFDAVSASFATTSSTPPSTAHRIPCPFRSRWASW